MTEKLNVYAVRTLSQKEYFAPGHRACQGCAEALAVRLVAKALGRNVIVAAATGCMEVISSPIPFTSWKVPWLHVAFENAAAVASGIESGLKALTRKAILPNKKIVTIAMAGDGGTADIGLQALSGALERGHNMIYVCTDNEAYMNTGIQRSSSTPFGASTTTSPAGKVRMGQMTWKKNMAAIAAAHKIPYVATACPSYPIDLVQKVKKAANTEGPAYLHILAVCPTGWKSEPAMTVELVRLAVRSGLFPVLEVEQGRQWTVNIQPEFSRTALERYVALQRRFQKSGTTPDDLARDIESQWQELIVRAGNTSIAER